MSVVMTHEDRAERRRQVAQAVRENGGDANSVAAAFGLSRTWVTMACREAGVKYVRATHGALAAKINPYAVLKALTDDPTLSMHDLARRLDVTFQRVQQLASQATEAGWDVPQVRKRLPAK